MMITVEKNKIKYMLLLIPFFEPGILGAFKQLTIFHNIISWWKVIVIAYAFILLFLLIGKEKRSIFLSSVIIYSLYIIVLTIKNNINVFHTLSQQLGIIALCVIVWAAFSLSEGDVIIDAAVEMLGLFLILNFITIVFFSSNGGMTANVDSVEIKNNTYFLGFYNQHIYSILPYVGLSLYRDYYRYSTIMTRTIIMHIMCIIGVIMIWSVDTVVAIIAFYGLLFFAKSKVARMLINPFIMVLVNGLASVSLIILQNYIKYAQVTERLFGKNLEYKRARIWNNYMMRVIQKPIFGYGNVDFSQRYVDTGAAHAHNMYLDIIYVSGVIGILFFFLIIILSMRNTFNSILDNSNLCAIQIAVFSFMIAFLATARTYCPQFFFLLAILDGISISAISRRDADSSIVRQDEFVKSKIASFE